MAPRSAPKRAPKVDASTETTETPIETPPEVAGDASSAEILKAVAKLQRSVNKTQRAIQALQTQAGAQDGLEPKAAIQKVKREPSGFAKPSRISNELSSFLGVPPDTRLARTQVTKLLTEYVKQNNLQCEENKRNIRLDDKLKQLLKVPEGTVVTFFNLQKHCKSHYISDEETSPSESDMGDIDDMERRLRELADEIRGIIRETPLEHMKVGQLRRMERQGVYMVRMLGSEIRALQKLKLEDSEDSDAETKSSSDDESLGGEDYRS